MKEIPFVLWPNMPHVTEQTSNILKKMRWSEQGLGRVSDWKQRIGSVPLVAIGGMTVERASGAFSAGANIISAVTDITLNDDPEERVRQWIAATRLPQ